MEEKTGMFKAAKKRGGFNAVDLLIVLAVVGIIVVFVASFFVSEKEEGVPVEIEYTLLIEGVDEAFADKIQVGDKAFDVSQQILLGRVSSVENSERYAVYEYDDESETIAVREYPDKYNVRVVLSSEAVFVDEEGYRVNGKRISVGGNLEVRFPEYAAYGYCVELKEVR